MAKRSWFKIQNVGPGRGELYLYGAIVNEKWDPEDADVTPVEFRDELKKLDGVTDIDMYINSPGGNVFAGLAIYQMLKRHPANITAHVDGIAASISFVIAMAADRILMPKTSMVLAHKALIAGIVVGNADDFVRMAEQLEAVDSVIVEAFKAKTGMTDKAIMDVMRKDAYMKAEDAIKLGFVDGYDDGATDRTVKNLDGIQFDAKAYLREVGAVVTPDPEEPTPPAEPVDFTIYERESNLRNQSLKLLEV